MACEDQISTQGLENAKTNATTLGEVATSRAGAVSTGDIIDTATNMFGETTDTVTGRLKKMGFAVPVVYAGGISFALADNVKTVDEGGIVSAPLPSALPFTTSGTWVGDDEDKFFTVQGLTNDQLINDRSQAYEFDTLTEMVNSPVEFPFGKIIHVNNSKWIVTDSGSVTPNLVDQRQSSAVPTQTFVYDNDGVLNFKHVGGGVGDTTQDNLIGARSQGYLTILMPYATYEFTDEIIGQNNQTWTFEGATLAHTDNTKRIMFFQSKRDFNLLGKATFLGLRPDTSDTVNTGEVGLNILNCAGYKIENHEFELFKGHGYLNDGSTSISPFFGGKGQITNITLKENIVGLELGVGAGAEYNIHTGVDAIGNDTGLLITAGNNIFNGGNVTKNGIGIELSAGGNDAHGIISSMNINHNTVRNVRVTDIVAGQTFDGCHYYADNVTSDAGSIEIINSVGIDFNGGVLFSRVITDESAQPDGYNFFRGMFCPQGPMRAINELGEPPKNTIFRDMFGSGTLNDIDSNKSINDPSDMYVSVQRNASNLQPISSGVGTALLFPDVLPSGDRRAAHNVATGETTIPLTLGGWYSIRASVVFEGSTIDESNSNISIRRNGVTNNVSYPNNKQSDESIEIDINYNVYLDGNDTIDLICVITGTDINHGYAWPSTLQINKLS